MRRVSIRVDQVRPENLWPLYETAAVAVRAHKEAILRAQQTEPPCVPDPHFNGMRPDTIETHFRTVLEALGHQFCLSLIAATEAVIRVDFLRRVYQRKKDPLSRRFRQLYAAPKALDSRRIRLRDILEVWASEFPASIPAIGDFLGALGYRDWLAHGRYWVPKLGRRYFPLIVQKIAEELLSAMRLA
jgi:hypothetical protein